MFDIHTHIIPVIDDGAKDSKMSLEIINLLKTQKVTDILLTPHYYSDEIAMESFINRRKKYYNILVENLQSNDNIYIGAEVYLTKSLFSNEDITKVCIQNTNKMLVELPFSGDWSNNIFVMIDKLREEGIIPIIAHVERYEFVIKRPNTVSKLISMGCQIQVNCTSVLQPFFKNRLVMELISSEKADYIASDTHNTTSRAPRMAEAMSHIQKKLGSQACDRLTNNSLKLLKEIKDK